MSEEEGGKKKRKDQQPFAELPPALMSLTKRGRPSMYDPEFCEIVLELGAEGKSKAQIAARLGINRDTLNEWTKIHPEFSVAVKNAQELALAWWEDAGQVNMARQGFNATAYIFQMKNRFREDYRDVTAMEHTGKNGGPIETRDVGSLTDDELADIALAGSPRVAAAAGGSKVAH